MPSTADVQYYIEQAAKARGIPDWIAAGIARAESGLNVGSLGDWWVSYLDYPAGTPVIARTPTGVIVPKGTKGAMPTSFGLFQLRAGKTVTGNASESGLGDAAVAAGIDITNPETWQQQVDFALNYAAQKGTFAGTWSTAVGDLAKTFSNATTIPIPDKTTGPDTTQTQPASQPQSFTDTLGAVAQAIASLPGGITKPFQDFFTNIGNWMTYLGQKNIYVRLLLGFIGLLLLITGIILFGVSFVDKGTAAKVSKALAL